MTDKGYLHHRSSDFGKIPEELMHDLELTDGAVRTYAHMHWRYGQNCKNFEGRRSIGECRGITEATVTKHTTELEAKNWIIIVPRRLDNRRTTNFYHVFESQEDCIAWRVDHDIAKPERKIEPRKGRIGVGGKPTHKPKDTQVEVEAPSQSQLEYPLTEPVNLNSSSQHYPDSESYPDSDQDTLVLTNQSAALPREDEPEPKASPSLSIEQSAEQSAPSQPDERAQTEEAPKESCAKESAPFSDLATRVPCPSRMDAGDTTCPTCGGCRWETLVDTGEKPAVHGEVVRRVHWHVLHCQKCSVTTIDPRQLIYEGDGDYIHVQSAQGRSAINMPYDEWNAKRYRDNGKAIAELFNKQSDQPPPEPTDKKADEDATNIPASSAAPATVQKPEAQAASVTANPVPDNTSLPLGYEWLGVGGQKHLFRASTKKSPQPALLCKAKYDGHITTGGDFSLFSPCLDCLEKAKPIPPHPRKPVDDVFDALIAGMLSKSTYDLTPADKAAKGGIVGPWLHGRRKDPDCGGLLVYECARTGRTKETLDYAELSTAAELFWQWYRHNDKTRTLNQCASFLSNWSDFRNGNPSPKDYKNGTGTRANGNDAGLLAQGQPGGPSVHYPGHKILRG